MTAPLSIFPSDFLDSPDEALRQEIDSSTQPFPDPLRIDPLERLFDPKFTPIAWEYEHSHVGELPGNLHPKQMEQLLNPAIHRHLFWGNQAGKTILGAVDCALLARGRHPLQKAGILRMPPVNIWASALTWELWQNILLPELLTWLPRWTLNAEPPPPFKMSTRRDIEVIADNGRISRITGKAAEQGAGRYQSARVDLVWLDEEHPEDVWDEMQPRLLRYGGRTLATMTPLLGMTYVYGRVYEPAKRGLVAPTRHFYSHAGIADNPAIKPEAIRELEEELAHNPAQLEARLSGHFTRPEGAVLPWDEKTMQWEFPTIGTKEWQNEHQQKWDNWLRAGRFYASTDHGKWRWTMQFGFGDHEGVFRLVEEYFSQNEDPDTRAKACHDLFTMWKVPPTLMWVGDCADEDYETGKSMTEEINDALTRMGSPYRMYPIQAAQKRITIGIDRLQSMLKRHAFLVRYQMGMYNKWRLGMAAGKPGKQVMGSRWKWEITNYRYPKMPDGKIQKDEPDKASADGADFMDGSRYLVQEFFPAQLPQAGPKTAPTTTQRVWQELHQMDEALKQTKKDYGHVLRQ